MQHLNFYEMVSVLVPDIDRDRSGVVLRSFTRISDFYARRLKQVDKRLKVIIDSGVERSDELALLQHEKFLLADFLNVLKHV